jgi:hypothetical protein
MSIDRHAMTAPNPDKVIHRGVPHVYTCHMAVMHWALMALGKTQEEANRVVGVFVVRGCPGCNNRGPHGSVDQAQYGYFCRGAIRIRNRRELFNSAAVGDILITQSPSMPMHSMVITRKENEGNVEIRGFNNTGTLGTGTALSYDGESRNVALDEHWLQEEQGLFRQGAPLHVVKNADFMRSIRVLALFA